MFKSIIVATEEIDSADDAVQEILDGVNEAELLPNTAAYLFCPQEYYDNGTVERLQKELPFPVVGTSASFTAVTESVGTVSSEQLSVTILTGDDVSFKVARFRADENFAENARNAALELIDGERPNLMLMTSGLCPAASASIATKIIDKATDGIPLYATVASSLDSNSETLAPTFWDGDRTYDTFVLAGLYGNITASYHMVNIRNETLTTNYDFITRSEGNVIYEISGKPATEFLTEINMTPKLGSLYALSGDDGVWIARVPLILTSSGNTAVTLTGDIPHNARICFGVMSKEEVLSSSTLLCEQIKPLLSGVKLAIVTSCMTRFYATAAKPIELENISKFMGDTHFIGVSSGGEVCPVKNESGEYRNAFHNMSLTICLLSQLHD
ncbi:hypothetical protein FACS1894133_7310 [Clostridia bacterium]|nr:hypothetical protein FACS1894133_7310 [Clostridia bacterium]